MHRRIIEDSFGKIVYWTSDVFASSRDTLFFLHGLTADHSMFEQQVFFFAETYNIIVWDAPAHGESRPYGEFTYENAANGLKMILDECNVSNVVLIGQSMGGFIAQAFICRYPELARAFVSIDSTPYGDYYSKSDMWWLRQIEWMAKMFPEKLLKSSMAKQNALSEIGRSNMAAMIEGYSKAELWRLMGIGYAGFLNDNRVCKIPCPVILLVGEKDNTGKVKAYNRDWARRTGYPLIWIPNAAHNSNVDNPAVVNEKIMDFVKTLK